MTSLTAKLVRPFLRPFVARPLNATNPIANQRRHFDRVLSALPAARGINTSAFELEHSSGLWLEDNASKPSNHVLLYLHGGAYIVGSSRSYKGLASRLCRSIGVPVCLLDYRLAPEFPLPAAVEDAYDAWQYLLAKGYQPNQILLAGDSAGGGLSCALLQHLKQKNETLPGAVYLISPWVDMTFTSDSAKTLANKDPLISLAWGELGRDSYIGADADAPTSNLLASPIIGDWGGMPPVFIQVGSDEVLLDDSINLTKKIQAAGGDVQCDVWPGMWHDFQLFAPVLPEARSAIAQAAAWFSGKIRR